jgi:ribonuclease J
MKITVYDGAETIGGNKIYVEEGGRGVFLDFGMNFAKYGQYFAEFLNERAVRGIHDSLYLNLIPKLNIYRTDLIPSDVNVTAYPELNVEAVLISHAHMDHCGNVGFLHESIPIVASATTLAVLKAMRDSGRPGVGGEIIYHSPREPSEDDRVLKTSNSPKDPYRGRDVVCVGELNHKVKDFLCYRPGQESNRAKKLEAGEVCCIDDRELPFDVKAFEIDHSIYGAVSYILYGDTAIAYTGDIRLHGKKGGRTKEFVREAKNVSVLIIEGTRAGREGDVNVSEQEVFENCLKAVEESRGIVIADFSPRNFERLETFKEIAEKTSRQLVVTAKDAYMLHAIELVDGVSRMDGVGIYGELKDKRDKWETVVVMDRWSDSYVDPVEMRQNPEGYILCFSYYDMKHLLDIKSKGGVYIYSSSEAFSEEQEFDFLRLYNWLETFNLRVYGFEMVAEENKMKPKFIKGYHASGHASKDDLRWMIETVDPDVVIPVHTDNPGWFEEEFENVRMLKDGDSVFV